VFDTIVPLTIMIFILTVILIIWKPFGLNETIPTTIGAFLLITFGAVSIRDLSDILSIVSGPSFTILSTIVMTIVLESVGFFRWVAANIIFYASGSGKKLFLYVILLCYFTTLFFNNDGSVLITTPIIINIVNQLKLKPHQKIPYLLSGALVATASSAPIAVSNIANLIALNMVGLNLNTYVQLLFIPSMFGITVMVGFLYFYFRHELPVSIIKPTHRNFLIGGKRHPLESIEKPTIDWKLFNSAIAVVILTRCSYFLLSPYGIPPEFIGISGAVILLLLRWVRTRHGFLDVIKRTPWHILLFAFSMYVIVFSLNKIGLTSFIVQYTKPIISDSIFNAIFFVGTLLSVLSNLVNNLPSVMIGTMALINMNLSLDTLQISYLASIIGSDIGSLLTPIGTLATLLWMFILKKNQIPFTWGQYFKITFMVIPITTVVTLMSFYIWTVWLFS